MPKADPPWAEKCAPIERELSLATPATLKGRTTADYMQIETKTCQNCKTQFTVEPVDFEFYKKMQVPAPTWCPSCRLQRRRAFTNERALYQRACDLCRKDIIAQYPAGTPFPVYCPSCWFSDAWDPLTYGREYDFSKAFFEQFYALMCLVPRVALNIEQPKIVNSPYGNLTGPMKDCHLVFFASDDERCLYSADIFDSQDCMDCTKVKKTATGYGLFNCVNCYQSIGSIGCHDCFNVYFSKNCSDCSDCFGCVNLRHKKYHWFNEQLSKEEYERRFQELDLSSRNIFLDSKTRVEQFWLKFPNRFMDGIKNENVTGDYISNSRNVQDSFDVIGAENARYVHLLSMAGTTDAYDFSDWGEDSSLVYECNNCGQKMHNAKFTFGAWNGSNWEYCDTISFCDDCVGCCALKKKRYCILNRQYTKEEYETLLPKIKKHMEEMPYIDSRRRIYQYGEFFPPEFSPFAYNETVAQRHFPLTKEQVLTLGWKWKDPEEKQFASTKKSEELPDRLTEVTDDILKEIILCAHEGKCKDQCTRAFKIIPQELAFYRKMNLPLPQLCHNCRNAQRLAYGRPYQLWERQCMCAGAASEAGTYKNTEAHSHGSAHCSSNFKTAYAPERPEIVYCEGCYKAEMS